MPYADPEHQRRAQSESHQRHRERRSEERKQRRRVAERVVRETKERPCEDCGVQYPPTVMALHHRPGVEKVGDVSALIRSRGLAVVEAEIAKCDVLCLNCHGLRHLPR